MTRRIDYIPIREVSNLTVIFYSHEAIYVCDRECVYVFHRWFVYDRTSYSRSFSPFRRFLMERKKITIQEAPKGIVHEDLDNFIKRYEEEHKK